MFFTISGNAKLDKELIRKATKKVGKRTSFLPKTIKYSVIETEEQLHVLGQVLEQENQSSVKLTLTLHDKEGKIEKAGTEYVFGSLDYQISEGFYPTLIDLIRLDIFKDTDETMSVEESYRNEKILQVLEEELESDQRKVNQVSEVEANEEVPWERPIFPKDESKEKEKGIIDEQADILTHKSIFEEENEVMGQLEVDPFEETMEDEETAEVEVDPVEANEDPTWTEGDSQEYIEPLISEEVEKNETEIQKATVFDYILDQYPPEHEWMKEKNKLFLNELYSKYQLPQTYQAFLESKEELISQGKGTLLEQLESVQSTNWHELAQEDLLATFEERQQETDQEINEYATEQSSNWEKAKEELNKEEQRVIEEEVQKIKERYEKKRDNAYSLCVEKINNFTQTNQEALSKEKENLLKERIKERKEEFYRGLRTDKLRISKELNEQLNKLYQTTTEVLMEKHEQIQQELQAQIPKWKKEYEIHQQELKEQEEKQRKKEKEREQLELKKREQDLAEQKMAIEKQRLEQEKEKEAAARKERQEQMDTLRQAQLNYLTHPQPVAAVQTPVNNQTNLTPSPQRSFNGWMVGCIASLSLLLGGGTVFAFNHINQSSQADSVATTASIKEEAQEQARKEYEQQLEELLNRTNQSTTESSMENSKESDSSKAKEGSSDSTVQSNTSESSESNEVK
ncbi:TPA: hypothetical protein IVO38_001541 [Enterococcus faecium]|uniref:hypothetical protein n=2 Tax=Enterococcus faecium TaxID=1352 RepID=UPI000A78EBDC|nr:hypothetical protein [Enterococcus faecium]HAQ1349627.1 hypothetical protein [Enterococcus faecium Ef_RPH1]HAQ1366676.1 hypothetical protein [Enterococcus faecium Ef_RPH2]HAQ1380939.1 hypothetical protein [Enterococcus faecium Ef_aus0091]HAQ1393632.1 hypothetical protein [Enterococcus faecium Ef_aus0040]HAQ1396628.1 hypothetical protein [Enterococcus faecium Ef_aus0048]HAQ1422683.1 hypothetical protein [Enterococcus faecium Ef_aus0039]